MKELEDAGFTLLMDDFGSGYSSLNMLKEAIVDILKIDMKFLDMKEEIAKKGFTILKYIIKMSNEMNLPIIVEGVETKEQAEFLSKMNVRYAQGYLYYKPMHVDDFEELLKDENNMDYRGIYNKQQDLISLDAILDDLLEPSQTDESDKQVDLTKALGAFFTYKADGSQELLVVDKAIANMFGCNTVKEFREYVGNTFMGMVHPEDRDRIEKEIWSQVEGNEWKLDYIHYRIIRKDGTVGYISDFGQLIEDNDGVPYFQVFLLDVTDSHK